MVRSADVTIVLVAVATRLAGTVSGVGEARVAVLTSEVPVAVAPGTNAWMTTVRDSPGASVPNTQSTTEGAALTVQVPALKVRPTGPGNTRRPSGSGSFNVTPTASDGPLLLAVKVYVTTEPAETGSGVADFRSSKLARSVTGVSMCTEPGGGVPVGGVADVTDAVFPTVPVAAWSTATGMRMIRLPFAASVGAVQVTVCAATTQVPKFGLGVPT